MKKNLLTIVIALTGYCASAQYLPLTGGTLTGPLLVNAAYFALQSSGNNIFASGSSGGVIGSGSATDYINYIYGNNPFSVWTNNAQRFTITGAGSIGVGISNPGYKLDIYNPVVGSALNVTGVAVGTRNDSGVDFSAVNGTIAKYARIGLQITSGTLGDETGGLTFSTISNGSFSEKMFISGSGNIGLGTTVPSSLLHLSSATNIDLKMFSTAAGGYSRLFFGAGTNGDRWNVGQRDDINGIFDIEGDASGAGAWGSRLAVTLSGNVGIGTTTPDSKLAVNGITHTQEVKVDMVGWPDYVFKSTYYLPTLTEVKTYIDQNHHLPDMPTEAEVVKNGLKVGETEAFLTKKVEELTLYLIEQNEKLQKINEEGKSKLQSQQTEIDQLKAQMASFIKLNGHSN